MADCARAGNSPAPRDGRRNLKVEIFIVLPPALLFRRSASHHAIGSRVIWRCLLSASPQPERPPSEHRAVIGCMNVGNMTAPVPDLDRLHDR